MFYTGPSVPQGNSSSTPSIRDITIDGFIGTIAADTTTASTDSITTPPSALQSSPRTRTRTRSRPAFASYSSRGSSAPPALWFRGLPESVITGVVLHNVKLTTTGSRGNRAEDTVAVTLCEDAEVVATDTTIDGVVWSGCNNTNGSSGGGGGGGDPPSGGLPSR
jgi:hypothetical protein